MLIDAPIRNSVLLAVIADQPAQGPEAERIKASLRLHGIAVASTYANKSKRQIELAKRANVDGILIVRAENSDGLPRLHLASNHLLSADSQAELQNALPKDWQAISGSELDQ
jgi:hypothetical protein